MFDLRTDDTIAAVSTPPGFGGIGIIRLSGGQALSIARAIFRPALNEESHFPERRAVFGTLINARTEEILDEGFALYFKAPRSYTGEDIVEISLHGSPSLLEEAIRLAAKAGARAAQPGEFTLRAYLTGRIDILQAEAVDDLIRAATLGQARIASRQVRGSLSGLIRDVRNSFIELLGEIEAGIEFPEDGLPADKERLRRRLEGLVARIEKLIRSYDAGKAASEGLTIALVGRTNVGKSTLFNALLGESRAIVTPKAGTTRDYLRERLRIDDAVFNLVDMAGLGIPSTSIEKEGMRMGRELAAGADGVIYVFDRSRPESADDSALLKRFAGKKSILVFNKSDRPGRMRAARLRRLAPDSPWLEVSALNGDNLPALTKTIAAVFAPRHKAGQEIIMHLRKKVLLDEILDRLKSSLALSRRDFFDDMIAEEFRGAIPAVERLTGKIRSEDILAEIFGRFCVGK
jgi:tRNA modification GTPase